MWALLSHLHSIYDTEQVQVNFRLAVMSVLFVVIWETTRDRHSIDQIDRQNLGFQGDGDRNSFHMQPIHSKYAEARYLP